MINLTSRLQYLVRGAALHKAVRESISRVVEILEEDGRQPSGPIDYQRFAFSTMFRKGTLPEGLKYDESYLDAMLVVVQTLPPTYPKEAMAALGNYSTVNTPPASGVPSLRRGLKLLLVDLWHKGALLLPTIFNAGPSFDLRHFSVPLMEWTRNFATDTSPTGRRLFYFGHRLLWASTWREPSDVSLLEVAALTRARVRHQHGKSEEAIACAAALPIGLFASWLKESFPDQVTYTTADMERYSNWVLSHSVADVSLEDYDPENRPARVRPPRQHRRKKPHEEFPRESVKDEDPHELILRNVRWLKKSSRVQQDWRNGQHPTYVDREHVNVAPLAKVWVQCFEAFMHHRKVVKGYREVSAVLSSLNLLADYLFFYLPWWKEVFPDSKVELPRTPRELVRYTFVSRHSPAPVSEVPVTLVDIIRMRRSDDTTRVALHHLRLLFDFIETNYADDESVAGPSFKSPLNIEFDAPRAKTKGKTNKEVIPKHIYGYLLFYCYAVEKFGMHLEEMAKAGTLPLKRKALAAAAQFEAKAFGFVPEVRYRGQSHPLPQVPNVWAWVERTLKPSDGSPGAKVYMPHPSPLRMLIASLESGLRVQSFQWLDRGSWRSLQGSTSPESYTFPLLVNTDKTKTHSWRTFIVYRLQHMLERQEAFQTQFADADAYGPVEYEGLEDSPFDPIRPLFRATGSGYPFSDAAYHRYWKFLMVGFEAFYHAVTGETHVRLYKLQPRLEDDGTPIVASEAFSRPYCPINIAAVHTPHSCRATFATNRKGVLALSDAAELLGHANEVVTAHYDKPDEDDIRQRLVDSDTAIVADFLQFQEGAAGHVRADKPDSALVKSFTRNRAAAVQAFKFMPSIALWSTEDSKEEALGLTLLREGPMSKIRYRETHICPVGEECPADILEQIGEPRRCGSCPLAMKCVDHLPAIAAKRNQLLERIKYLHNRREQLEERGEPHAVLDEVWEAIELDANELIGWQLSEEILGNMLETPADDGSVVLHVEQPEVVKRHLKRVSRSSTAVELMLQRIADSNAYPSLATPQVMLAANQVKRRLMAGQGLDALTFEQDGFDDLKGVSAMLALMMKTEGISMKQVAAELSAPARPVIPVLTAKVRDGS